MSSRADTWWMYRLQAGCNFYAPNFRFFHGLLHESAGQLHVISMKEKIDDYQNEHRNAQQPC